MTATNTCSNLVGNGPDPPKHIQVLELHYALNLQTQFVMNNLDCKEHLRLKTRFLRSGYSWKLKLRKIGFLPAPF